MKTSLKRSEIIKQLKRIFGCNSLSIYRVSDILVSHFERHYICIVQYSGNSQVVEVNLLYGWINFLIHECYSSLPDAQTCYIDVITKVVETIYLDHHSKLI